jgi:ribose 5-phosphate isomerase RpiB
VTDAVVDNGDVGIVLTRQPSVALCRANRHASVRAAWGVNVAAVKEAVQSIGANVLVVNPSLHGVYELRGILREFASGNHACPKQYREALET